jgi:hypothetical protein
MGSNSSASALGWHSEAGEVCRGDGLCAGTEYMSCEAAGEAEGCATVGEMVEESSITMGALFNQYGPSRLSEPSSRPLLKTSLTLHACTLHPFVHSFMDSCNFSHTRKTTVISLISDL